MFYAITGQLVKKSPTLCVLSLRLGESTLQVEIRIPLTVYERLGELGENVTLYLYPAVVRGEFQLFGFLSEDDRHLFKTMLQLPNIGPGLALRVLSGMSARELVDRLESGDLDSLSKIKGIGAKRAERIAFELSGFLPRKEEGRAGGIQEKEKSLREALKSLGMKNLEAEKAAKRALETLGADATLEDLIKEVLKE